MIEDLEWAIAITVVGRASILRYFAFRGILSIRAALYPREIYIDGRLFTIEDLKSVGDGCLHSDKKGKISG